MERTSHIILMYIKVSLLLNLLHLHEVARDRLARIIMKPIQEHDPVCFQNIITPLNEAGLSSEICYYFYQSITKVRYRHPGGNPVNEA